jgi:putative ABC transport system permease protein
MLADVSQLFAHLDCQFAGDDMKMFKRLIVIALRNLLRYRTRSMVAVISITSGFVVLNLFEGYIADAVKLFDITYSQRLMYGDIIIERENQLPINPPLQKGLENILAKQKNVAVQVRFLNLSGMITNGSTTTAFVGYGYDVEAGSKMRQPHWEWNTFVGHPLTGGETVLLGQGLGKILGCEAENKRRSFSQTGGYEAADRPFHCKQSLLQLMVSTPTGQMSAANVTVSGMIDAIYRELDQRAVVLPLARAQGLLGTQDISFYTVRAKHSWQIKRLIKNLNEDFASKKLPLAATSWKQHRFGEIYVQSLDFLRVFQVFTIIVVLVIVILSVFTTMVRMVHERSREIGTLRSLGFRASVIYQLFILESLALGITGCLFGAVLARLLAWSLNSLRILYKIGILSEEVPFHIILPGRTFMIAGITLTALAVVASLAALNRAIRSSIPENLTHRS